MVVIGTEKDDSLKGSEPAVPGFQDFTSSPKCPLSPNKSVQERNNKNNFIKNPTGPFKGIPLSCASCSPFRGHSKAGFSAQNSYWDKWTILGLLSHSIFLDHKMVPQIGWMGQHCRQMVKIGMQKDYLQKEVENGVSIYSTKSTSTSDGLGSILPGNGGRFSGGFDITVFGRIHKTGDISILVDVSVDLVVDVIDAKKPVVAAIEGLALGDGLELALVCI